MIEGAILATVERGVGTADMQGALHALDLEDQMPHPHTRSTILVAMAPPVRDIEDWRESDSNDSSSMNTAATLNEAPDNERLLDN